MNKNTFINSLTNPEQLEMLYHKNPDKFKVWMAEVSEKNSDSDIIKVWQARLNYSSSKIHQKMGSSLTLVIILSLLSSLLIKLPSFFKISKEWFYPRFIPLIIFSALIVYFLRNNNSKYFKAIILGGILICTLIYFLLPHNLKSASLIMAQIHMPLILLSLVGIAFMGKDWKKSELRLQFIRYVGEITIYTGIILIGGIVLTLLTFGLFDLIGLSIQDWYVNYVVVIGLAAAPLVATFLYDVILNRDSKLAVLISNVFSPLFLITVSAYLVAVIYQGKSPYSDRNFLIIFNGLLIIVLSITVFSISGISSLKLSQLGNIVNISLISVTLAINAVALSAIVFRLSEFGVTPNRIAVTGVNILIFVHLLLLLIGYLKYLRNKNDHVNLINTVGNYLPIYTVWSLLIAVLLPILFKFK